MPALVVASSDPSAGKTTVIVGLAQNLQRAQHAVTALRLHSGDPFQESPLGDAHLYALQPFLSAPPSTALSVQEAISFIADLPPDRVVLIENDAGLPIQEVAQALNARVLLVRGPEGELTSASQIAGLVGVIVNRVPERRLRVIVDRLSGSGLPNLGLVPEDPILASFTVGQLQDALAADVLVGGDFEQVVQHVVVGPVSADPGRDYFSRFPDNAVITRSHKPDLLLAALDAGTTCLVIAGGRPPLEYVIDRAQSYEVPVLLTMSNTYEATRALEKFYASSHFRGQMKVDRADELVAAHVAPEPLMRALQLV
jgi:BioD-like phosphotransacetylase family protein